MDNTPKMLDLPVVVLRNTVFFPNSTQQLEVVRIMSNVAVRHAIDNGQEVFVAMQADPSNDDPEVKEINHIGVVASVVQVIKGHVNGVMRVKLKCKYRAQAELIYVSEGMMRASVSEMPFPPVSDGKRQTALMNSLIKAAKRYGESSDQKTYVTALECCSGFNDLAALICFITHLTPLNGDVKQNILNQPDTEKCCVMLLAALENELDAIGLQREIERQVKANMERSQREYYLREQMKVISEKLGDSDSPLQEADEYRERISKLAMPEETKQQLLKTCSKLAKLPSGSHEAAVERNYIDVCLSLPWGVFTEDKLDVAEAQKLLDRDHFGMEKVKERILEFIAVRSLAPDIKGQIICLVGPPGVGKTSIARSVAEAMGRKYCRVSLGGVHDEADIRGHRKTYIGAMPGRITNALKLAGTNNPLILLDEVDKLASDFKGDPTSALLEVLDPEQNVAFHDHYVDLPIDLSSVMFITTANDASRIPAPLLDRMEVIQLPSYTLEEKCNIAKLHIIKKQLARHGLNGNQLRFTAKSIPALIEGYTREAGVRNMEREIANLCRKAAKKIALDGDMRITVTDKNLTDFLGPVRYSRNTAAGKSAVGMCNGLAWTSVGGTMLEIEVAVLDGTGKLELTGSLGDVMKESARTAVSYIRSQAERFGIDPDFYKNKDIHIHAPEGATPKDGPSAGVTMTTAIISALTGIPVRADVAMTGEVTLRGRVLQIGGLREKSMAAYTAGITTVIIPESNQPDISQLSEKIRSGLTFIPASHINTVLENALEYMPTAVSPVTTDTGAHLPIITENGGNPNETGESRI